MLKAVIFDLDGVIADSHPIHEAAWKTLLAEQGLDPATINVDFLYAGHPRREILTHYLGALSDPLIERLGRRKVELYLRAAENLAPKPGIPRVLCELQAAGIALAVATSAGRIRTEETLAKFNIAHRFAAVVSGNDVRAAKPTPDIFLLAASKLGVTPDEVVVVEDSVAGVRAAHAAVMSCVGYVPRERMSTLIQAGADEVITEFPPDAAQYFRGLLERDSQARSPRRARIAVRQRD
jgi:HAD superfamily hydrolase (TIGR01509 family)